VRRPQRQARPGIGEAEHLAHDVKRVATISPPVRSVVGIVRDRVNERHAIVAGKPVPKHFGPPRVDRRGDKNYGFELLFFQGRADGDHLVGRVDDGGIEYFDGSCGNTLVNQDLPIVFLFADVRYGKARHSRAGLQRMSEPDAAGIALLVDSCGLKGALRHVATEDRDGGRWLKRVVEDKPFTYVEKNQNTAEKNSAEQ